MAKSRNPEVDAEVDRSKYYSSNNRPLVGQRLRDTREGDRQSMDDLADDERYGEKQMQPAATRATKPLGSFKKGGTVSKTGTYKLHKGERVVPVKKKSPTSRKR